MCWLYQVSGHDRHFSFALSPLSRYLSLPLSLSLSISRVLSLLICLLHSYSISCYLSPWSKSSDAVWCFVVETCEKHAASIPHSIEPSTLVLSNILLSLLCICTVSSLSLSPQVYPEGSSEWSSTTSLRQRSSRWFTLMHAHTHLRHISWERGREGQEKRKYFWGGYSTIWCAYHFH